MHDDIVRTEDIQNRIYELEDELTTFLDDTCESAGIDEEHDNYDTLREETTEVWEKQTPEGAEYRELSDLIQEVGKADYLIHDSHFEDYVEELLRDCGDVPDKLPWYVVIDWEATAKNIRGDYSELEWDGHTYLYQDN